ncbi:uncharacterized [Tachysurus ichikawai]
MFVWSEEGYCAPGRMVASDMRLGVAIYVQLDYFAFKFTRHPSGRQTKLRPDVSPSGPRATAASGANHTLQLPQCPDDESFCCLTRN